MGISGSNRLMAFACVIGPVCGDNADVLIGRDLVQEFRQYGSISNVTAGDFDCPHFQRFFVDAYMYLKPHAALGAAMLVGIPLAFTFGFDPRAIDKKF